MRVFYWVAVVQCVAALWVLLARLSRIRGPNWKTKKAQVVADYMLALMGLHNFLVQKWNA